MPMNKAFAIIIACILLCFIAGTFASQFQLIKQAYKSKNYGGFIGHIIGLFIGESVAIYLTYMCITKGPLQSFFK